MQIVIDIPKEYEEHFVQDRFEDSLRRLSADAHLLAGRYEQETAIMLIDALKNGTILPKGHRRLIDAEAYYEDVKQHYFDNKTVMRCTEITLDSAPTIIEADGAVKGGKPEAVDHPAHYNQPGKRECIAAMEEDYGYYITVIFCLTNAYKYLYRAGDKPGADRDEDIRKARWYVKYADGILEKIEPALAHTYKVTRLYGDVVGMLKDRE